MKSFQFNESFHEYLLSITIIDGHEDYVTGRVNGCIASLRTRRITDAETSFRDVELQGAEIDRGSFGAIITSTDRSAQPGPIFKESAINDELYLSFWLATSSEFRATINLAGDEHGRECSVTRGCGPFRERPDLSSGEEKRAESALTPRFTCYINYAGLERVGSEAGELNSYPLFVCFVSILVAT